MKERNKTIGSRIKELRKQAGLTQKSLAEYLGADQSFISKVEKGERALTSVHMCFQKLQASCCSACDSHPP